MKKAANYVISLTRNLQGEVPLRYIPPSEGTRPRSEMVLPHSIVKGTRGYIERIVYQINGCYEYGWFDGCAVMMRRLLETLIIETFEHFRIASKIKTPTGDFFRLSDLISATLRETAWTLGKKSRQELPHMKDLGDLSAHSRRFIATREDIDKVQADYRTIIQELVILANLK